MAMRSTLVLVLLASLMVAPAGAAPDEPGPPGRALSTPELLERAVDRGGLDRATADLYLAYALGEHRKLPARFVGDVPWDGTLPLLRLRERVKRMPPGPRRASLRQALHPAMCGGELAEPDLHESAHFHIHYDSGTLDPSLTITDYAASLDLAWETEVVDFGWAAPPLGGFTAYPVVVTDLGTGLYGFVANTTQAPSGNNPSTPWDDDDAFASCMALNEDYTGFPSGPQESMDATIAHEFNHSIQFGYGAITGPNRPDEAFIEGGATWMEDEVFDDANDNYHFLWPDFSMSMGAFNDSPYPYWVVFRALTERHGTGIAGAGEQVMQDFWEETSQSTTSNQFPALSAGLAAKGTTLADAFHAAAIAIRLGQPCGGAWTYPHCLEESPGYAAVAGPFPNQGAITAPNTGLTGSIPDDYAINWVTLPSSGPYPVTLSNSSQGGALRAAVACVTGTGPKLAPLPDVVGAGAVTTLTSFDPADCTVAPVAVITNQAETAANPAVSTPRSYELTTGLAPKAVKLKAKPRQVDRGDRTRLRARVTPCQGHQGDMVRFFRKKKRIATIKGNSNCVAKVKVQVLKTSTFRAVSPQQDSDHLAGTSNKVKVRVRRS